MSSLKHRIVNDDHDFTAQIFQKVAGKQTSKANLLFASRYDQNPSSEPLTGKTRLGRIQLAQVIQSLSQPWILLCLFQSIVIQLAKT